ncbi:MAG TPA: hypothetical protein EYP19_14940 [Desulfobacterales bacterium]|nr:hypothetical protein [Desulfobacterales bacterium]
MSIFSNECVICGKKFKKGELYLSTSGCAFPQEHRLWKYCDAPMHLLCLESWPDREEFSEAYYVQRREQYDLEGFLILAERDDWFVGFIPPGRYMGIKGAEDLVEIRIRDWPFVLYGKAGQWTEFINGGWLEDNPFLSEEALQRASAVIKEVGEVLPDSETIVDLVSSKGCSGNQVERSFLSEAMATKRKISELSASIFQVLADAFSPDLRAVGILPERFAYSLSVSPEDEPRFLQVIEKLLLTNESFGREAALVILAFRWVRLSYERKGLDQTSWELIIEPNPMFEADDELICKQLISLLTVLCDEGLLAESQLPKA